MRDNLTDYEWDEEKNRRNRLKHGIDFLFARQVFWDPFLVEEKDDRQDYGEDRYEAVGMVDDSLLPVIYSVRDGKIRIISARRAGPYERRKYHQDPH